MSILIKGIDAPKYGFIEIRLYDNRAEGEFQEHEYTDLEIEEVPEPHGRLIDAEPLEHRSPKLKALILQQPTVIEAEK